ncbi:MAG TPA: M1 family metallopeptidase [Labilithrix sp.]|nr:M1 family metallopeptidase [Labilithrix sp.]
MLQLRALARCVAVVMVAGVATGWSIRPSAALEGAPATTPSAPDVPMLEHPEKVVDYTLRAKLDPAAHTVHGEGTITWRNVSRTSVSELWMHLYLNAFKNQSSVFMRAPIGGFRGSTIPKEWGTIDVRKLTWLDGAEKRDLWSTVELHRKDDEDETDARIPLPRPVAAGETITLEVVWDDKLPAIVERTGFDGSFHMVAQWFPKLAKIEADGTFAHFPFHHLGEFYADYGSYDVTVDVPESFTIGATGPATESKVEGGRRVERHVQADIHDFAWTAWDRFVTRKETIDGVACTILYPPGYDDHAERELATMRFAIPHYGARYGKYPYGVLTLVHPPASAPEAGGMEYPTLITTGSPSFTPNGANFPEVVTIHEFGHQYFYGLIGSHETKWPFLDEGLNSYAETEALRVWKGPANAIDLFGLSIGDVESQAERARHSVHDDRVAQPAYAFGSGTSYGALVYSRTDALLETLRRVYGDASMQRMMGAYARRFRFKHPVPQDFVQAVQREMGNEAGEIVRASLFDKGWIDFKVEAMSSHVVRAAAGLFDVGGKRETIPADRETAGKYTGWVLVIKRGTLNVPVEVELISEDGARVRVPWDGATDSIRVPYSGSSALRAAVIDPDHRVLLDQDPANDFATASGHAGGGAPRTLERATYWAELVMGAVGP